MCISWTINGLISLMHGVTMKITFHDVITVCLLYFNSERSDARTVRIMFSTPHESLPLSFNIARCHSGVEMSTESDRSAVFDGVSGGGCRLFCLTLTQPPSLPCSLFSLCLRGYDGVMVGEYMPTFRRTVVSSNSGGSCPKILSN